MHDKHAPGHRLSTLPRGKRPPLKIEGRRTRASGSETLHLAFILHDGQISGAKISSPLSRSRSDETRTQTKKEGMRRRRLNTRLISVLKTKLLDFRREKQHAGHHSCRTIKWQRITDELGITHSSLKERQRQHVCLNLKFFSGDRILQTQTKSLQSVSVEVCSRAATSLAVGVVG